MISVTENTALPTLTCKSAVFDNGRKPVVCIDTFASLLEGNSEGETDEIFAIGCGIERSLLKSKLCKPRLADALLAILIFVLTTLSNGGIKISMTSFSESDDKTWDALQVRRTQS